MCTREARRVAVKVRKWRVGMICSPCGGPGDCYFHSGVQSTFSNIHKHDSTCFLRLTKHRLGDTFDSLLSHSLPPYHARSLINQSSHEQTKQSITKHRKQRTPESSTVDRIQTANRSNGKHRIINQSGEQTTLASFDQNRQQSVQSLLSPDLECVTTTHRHHHVLSRVIPGDIL